MVVLKLHIQRDLCHTNLPLSAPAERVILPAKKMVNTRQISGNLWFFSDVIRLTLFNIWDQHIPLTEFLRSAQRTGLVQHMQGSLGESTTGRPAPSCFDCLRVPKLQLKTAIPRIATQKCNFQSQNLEVQYQKVVYR